MTSIYINNFTQNLAQFRAMDAEDGTLDGKIDLKYIPPELRPLDVDNNGLTFVEIVTVNQDKSVINDQIDSFIRSAKNADLTDKETGFLLAAIIDEANNDDERFRLIIDQSKSILRELFKTRPVASPAVNLVDLLPDEISTLNYYQWLIILQASKMRLCKTPEQIRNWIYYAGFLENLGQAHYVSHMIEEECIRDAEDLSDPTNSEIIDTITNYYQAEFLSLLSDPFSIITCNNDLVLLIDRPSQVHLAEILILYGYIEPDTEQINEYASSIAVVDNSYQIEFMELALLYTETNLPPQLMEQWLEETAIIDNLSRLNLALCLHENNQILFPSDMKIWAPNLESLQNDANATFIASLPNYFGFSSDELLIWQDNLNWLSNNAQVKVLEHLMDPHRRLIEGIDDLEDWRPGIERIENFQQAQNITSLISKGFIKTPTDLQYYFDSIEHNPQPYIRCSPANTPLLNEEELEILSEIETLLDQSYTIPSRHRDNEATAVFYYVAERNIKNPIPRDLGFSGHEDVLSTTVNWQDIFTELESRHPGITDKYLDVANQYLFAVDSNNIAEVQTILNGIPTRELLERVLRSDNTHKLARIIARNWEDIRPLLGHIFYGEDKIEYQSCLESMLASQDIPWGQEIEWGSETNNTFQAPFVFINLETMEKKVLYAEVQIIGQDQLLISSNSAPDNFLVRMVNPRDASTMKAFARDWMAEAFDDYSPSSPYFVYYFPKVSFSSPTTYTINTNYEDHETNPALMENTVLQDMYDANLPLALEKFDDAFAHEDEYLEASKTELAQLLDEETLAQIQTESYLDIDDIYQIMLRMSNGSAVNLVANAFHISGQEYQEGEDKVYRILEENQDMTRLEFIAKLIEAFDGQVMLALATAYNTLLPMGQFYDNSLMVLYPQAFQIEEDAQDIAGTIYHYIGCTFGAYAVQKCLVERYHVDQNFRIKIDAEYDTLRSKFNLQTSPPQISGLNELEMLKLNQYAFLHHGNETFREVTTLAGIFWEEVMEDHDITDEVYSDMKGISAGHALIELAYDKQLSRNQGWSPFNNDDNRRRLFVRMLTGYVDPSQLSSVEKAAIAAYFYAIDK